MKSYTAIIRKSRIEYVALCLELNISSQGDDIAEVEKNLKSAIELFLDDIKDNPQTYVQSTSAEELIEFFRDTESESLKEQPEGMLLRPYAIHEVRTYA